MMSKYILLDTEATGKDEEDRIIQLAFIVLDQKEFEVYDDLCFTDIDIKFEAMEVHNISPEMIKNLPKCIETDAYKALVKLNIEDNYIIMHNAPFDLAMLEKEGFVNKMKVIDTLRCAKHLYKDLDAYRLQYLRYYLEIYKEEKEEAKKLNLDLKAHNALSDVVILKLFLRKLQGKIKENFKDTNPINKMLEFSNRPVLIEKFKFGKHKDKFIKNIIFEDSSYIQWLLKQDLDEDLKYSINYFMKN